MATTISGNSPTSIGDDTTINGDITADNLPTNGSIVGYQQGTWTPTVSQGTVTANNTQWVRTGNQVTVWATLTQFSNTTNSAVIEVLGLSLPYITDEDLRATTQIVGSCYVAFIGREPTAVTLTNTNSLRFSSTAAGEEANLLTARYSDIGSSGAIRLVATYTTSDTTWTPATGATLS
jgi:hypothetical protein